MSMHQSLILSDIGLSIQQLLGKLDTYDNINTIRTSVNKHIRCIEAVNRQRNLSINFNSLESHRSACSSYGPSFLQKHRLLYIRLQQFLKTRTAFQDAASDFLDNPSLLRENPHVLLQHFCC